MKTPIILLQELIRIKSIFRTRLQKRMAMLCLAGLLSFSSFAGPNEDLIAACMKGDIEAVKTALAGGAHVNYVNPEGWAAITYAVLWPDIVQLMIDKGADVNNGQMPPLVFASSLMSIDVMKILMAKGADPAKVTKQEVKVDMDAAINKLIVAEEAKGKDANAAMVKAYKGMITGKPPTVTVIESRPIAGAFASGCKKCMELFTAAGVSLKASDDPTGKQMETFALSANPATTLSYWPQVVKTYEDKGFKIPDWFRDIGLTDFMTTEERLEYLIKGGYNVNAKTASGNTPLGYAVASPIPNEELIMALIEKGADIKPTGKTNDPTEFKNETAKAESIKVKFDFPGEGRNSKNGGGYSANVDLLNPKPKRVALISYYLYDAAKGKTKGGSYAGIASADVWRTPDGVGQVQVDGFYAKSINQMKTTFKENGIDLLTPDQFLDTDEKFEFYHGFNPETAKKEKTTMTKRKAAGSSISSVAIATVTTLKICPSNKGYKPFFIANEEPDASMQNNFQGGMFTADRKLTSSLGYDLAKGLGVDAVVVVYIATRKLKKLSNDYGVNAVVTMMLGPNPGKTEVSDPDAKNLGQFYCGTRTFYNSPVIFKEDKGIFGQYDGMANLLSAHATKMCNYVNGKEKDSE